MKPGFGKLRGAGATFLVVVLAVACGGGSVSGDALGEDAAVVADAPDYAGVELLVEGVVDWDTWQGPHLGSPCTTHADCGKLPLFCAFNYPGGYCMASCETDPCPLGGWCGQTSAGHFCYEACAAQWGCRSGYACAQSETPICLPAVGTTAIYLACSVSSDCVTGACVYLYCGDGPCATGVCSQSCTGGAACPSPGFCAMFMGKEYCATPCAVDGDCPQGQTCHDGTPSRLCAP